MTLQEGEVVKVQLGAQIDGFGAIVGDTVVVGTKSEDATALPERIRDLLVGTYYANELLLRLMLPPGLLSLGTDEEKKKAASVKPYTQTKINSLLNKVAQAYGCSVVESTTCWQFDHNEIEAKKKIVLAPGEGVKGEGTPEVGEVWGVELGLSLGSGKVKSMEKRTTLHRRTTTTYGLKRPSSRQTLSEIVRKFGTFPFSLRQLEDERAAKIGVVECVRGNVLRQYEVVGDKDGEPVSRLFSTVVITKNGLTRISAPTAIDISKYEKKSKITDEEVLKILELPLLRSTGSKGKNKKKKKKQKPAAQKPAATAASEEDSEDDSSEEESSDEE